jgi:branched-subunit amino acid transport protein
MDFSVRNPQIWAGLLAVAVAWRTRSVVITIAAGMVALLGLQLLLG